MLIWDKHRILNRYILLTLLSLFFYPNLRCLFKFLYFQNLFLIFFYFWFYYKLILLFFFGTFFLKFVTFSIKSFNYFLGIVSFGRISINNMLDIIQIEIFVLLWENLLLISLISLIVCSILELYIRIL